MTAHTVPRAQATPPNARPFHAAVCRYRRFARRGRSLRLLRAVADLAEPPTALDAPAIPITVAGVLFDVPPAAIREAVQRHPGQQDRIDLAFEWPSLAPPRADDKPADKTVLDAANAAAAAAAPENRRLFVTIAGLGSELPPLERLRTIYPRYVETKASAGPDGLAILPFRAGTPYDGQDLVYFGTNPEQFFALCTRRAEPCPAPAFRNECSAPPRSRSAFHAIGSAIGARSPPVSTGSSLNCIRSEIDGSPRRQSAITGHSGQIHIQDRHFKNIGAGPLLIVDE